MESRQYQTNIFQMVPSYLKYHLCLTWYLQYAQTRSTSTSVSLAIMTISVCSWSANNTSLVSASPWLHTSSRSRDRNGKLSSKLTILCFWSSLCSNFGHICSFHSFYDPPMPYKVYFWHWLVCTTICSVHLWSYSVPNGKFASNLTIFDFLP